MTRRVAFVTGGGRGIGAATAHRLAAAGMAVVVADRDLSAARSVASAVDGLAVQVDVSRPDEVEAAVARAVSWGGGLHYAYNNAGVPGVVAELAEYPDKVFWRVQQVNVGGVFACMRAELRHMLAFGGGSIVNAASGAGTGGVAGSSAYVASKHAVIGLTKTAAVEYASRGIRVNAVAPGLVRTSLVAGVDGFEAAHPIGRAATPEEVAEVVWWLLHGGSTFVTGAVVPVDGGLTAQVPGLS